MGRDPMSAMRAVTFDAGRTLLHWGVEPRRAFAELCRRAGIAVTEAGALHGARACARFWQASPPPPAGHAPEAWWLRHHAAGLRAAGVAGDLEACCRALQAAATSADAGWVVDPDAPLVLDALRARGFVLAVVANADGTVAEGSARSASPTASRSSPTPPSSAPASPTRPSTTRRPAPSASRPGPASTWATGPMPTAGWRWPRAPHPSSTIPWTSWAAPGAAYRA